MPSPPKPRQPLCRERVVSTALALVDAEGLEALSMRRLGAALGMATMAVYHYLPNKAALLDAVVEAVMAEIDLGVDDPSRPVEERLVRAAKAYGEALVRHSNTLPLLMVRGPVTPAGLAPVELMVGILRCGGLSLENAVAGMHMLAAAVRGYAAIMAREVADPEDRDVKGLVALTLCEEFPNLGEAAGQPQRDLQAQFEFGLRAIAVGLLEIGGGRRPSGGTDGNLAGDVREAATDLPPNSPERRENPVGTSGL